MDNTIDFIIIGAQKSGTTSLFKYLSAHPRIYMPAEKEIEYFQNDDKFSKGREWYYKRYFDNAGSQEIKGEASTHYMMYESVPGRIQSYYPDIKLIACLRNPIDRAYSHYNMAVRRGVEKRSFKECVDDAIERGHISDSEIDDNLEYVMFGEYGRILKHYLNWFKPEQVKVVFSEDLRNKPELVTRDLFRWLEVDADFVPPNVGKQYHQSGDQRFPGLNERARRLVKGLKKNKWANRHILWRIDFDALFFWLETEFNVKSKKIPLMSPEVREKLARYYQPDVEMLEKITGQTPPWKDFK